MEMKELQRRPNNDRYKKLSSRYDSLEKLISALKDKDIPLEIVNSVNKHVEYINSFEGSDKDLSKQLLKTQSKILELVEKELKLVPKNHYRNLWLAIGMAVFGLPLGAAFGLGLDNMAFIGIGLPMGILIGMAVGSEMDKKARQKGRQLDLEI
jgi:hypothetical protein